LFQS
jgi:hypothetical protein